MTINPLNDISRVYLEQVSIDEAKKGDGNLANNYPPYDKVTRGDVIAGATGKDQMGGKNKKKIKEGNDGNLANNYPPYDKVTRGDVIAGRLGKDQMGGKKKKVKEDSDYDPMDDDDFNPDEAEKNRGVSGKNNPKGGKSLSKKKSVKEGYSNWRQDLSEVITDVGDNKKIKEKKINNKIKINPKLGEAIEQLGGVLIEMVEVEQIDEKITAKTDMGTAIKDFYASKSPQLAGRSKEQRRKAAIAAVLTARRGGRKLGEQMGMEPATQATSPVVDKKKEMLDKQQLANMKTLQQKKQQLDRQKLLMQKSGKLPLDAN